MSTILPDNRRLRGEELKQTKLTESIVRDIRRDYAASKNGARYYAEIYGVSRATITLLLRRETWAWVAE